MTEISFHFNVVNLTGYACRLLRKAMRQGSGVAVTGPEPLLVELDSELWTFAPAEFVPHAWVADSGSVPASLHDTTVWLAPDPAEAPVHAALVNMGETVPRGFESFGKLIELVSTAEHVRSAARERWKGYARRGYAIVPHEASA